MEPTAPRVIREASRHSPSSSAARTAVGGAAVSVAGLMGWTAGDAWYDGDTKAHPHSIGGTIYREAVASGVAGISVETFFYGAPPPPGRESQRCCCCSRGRGRGNLAPPRPSPHTEAQPSPRALPTLLCRQASTPTKRACSLA